jgi:hypothetical protein
MPSHVQISQVIDRLRSHPALKSDNEAYATVTETYVLAFDFRRSDSREILRHEQEFGESSKWDEMEVRRKSWFRIRHDSDRKSPLALSMLDFGG